MRPFHLCLTKSEYSSNSLKLQCMSAGTTHVAISSLLNLTAINQKLDIICP